ncbi:MAG: lipoyl synthase, partial [Moorea sp. SIO2C4]|nr:lipoyl synthase [Moorena sp. SIO2C4]
MTTQKQWRSEITALPSWLRRPIGNASDISTVQR